MDQQDYEDLGYEEPAVKAEEFWFFTTCRDAGELITKYGAREVLAGLSVEERKELIKEVINSNGQHKTL